MFEVLFQVLFAVLLAFAIMLIVVAILAICAVLRGLLGNGSIQNCWKNLKNW